MTISAGLLRGLSREAAARFAFLLAVPAMTAAGLSALMHVTGSDVPVDTRALLFGATISAVTGFACIHYFLKWLTRFGLLPYVIYRLILGTALLFILL